MAFSEQEKKRFKAIIRRLRKEKGIRIYKHELDSDIAKIQNDIKAIEKIKEEHKDTPVVVEEADKAHKKLKGIIDDLNDYMSVLHPEGLIDLGDDGENKPRKTALASG